LRELLAQKDRVDLWVNLPLSASVYQHCLRFTLPSRYRLVNADAQVIEVEEMENQQVVRTTSITVGEIFGLAASVRWIVDTAKQRMEKQRMEP